MFEAGSLKISDPDYIEIPEGLRDATAFRGGLIHPLYQDRIKPS